ncbi:MotA/TolQ/ExbB proton channel family protein [Luteolibacter ambystomatis]|uniref:MotA/TolQ/ExbB proton channel family protein n=1 Tax=Luteolibacter ambystomatis TaxID=2824561 RepID=A0A975J2P6_9BACT|nr:MotA/TolQ/ExbB proton channel family protein [Luteolibacter ambystomatis]QUE52940.1 MotA/TolQ/ExbB proton channel family protein [Luteolibacter ambystomatis]
MYEPPQAPALPLSPDPRKPGWAKAGVIVGAVFMLAPVLGAVGTANRMSEAFKVLGSSGIGDPHALGEKIGEVLIVAIVGFGLFPVGIIVLVVSLLKLRKYQRQAAALPGDARV